MAVDPQANYRGGRFSLTAARDLWWTSRASIDNHQVFPVIDHHRREIELGCQTATFAAVSRLFWFMVRERVKWALRRQP